MPRVHILPLLPSGPDPGDGGIRQVVRAQHRYLPEFGWEVVANPDDADVLACHVEVPPQYQRLYPDKPLVIHNHGAYWAGYDWQGWCYDANLRVLESLRLADITTAVSEWTRHTLARHSSRDIRTVHHGVDLAEWQPDPAARHDFVLWNKTRVDPICDPQPVLDLAQMLPGIPFITTHVTPGARVPFNVEVTGTQPFEESKRSIRGAGVYLCTTRETFGIGTLEALACGVPVVGYAWGGQVEIIEQGVDGWLVRPGDIAGLAEGVRWALGNEEARAAARRKAEQFPAVKSVAQYAAIYSEALERRREVRPKVSVIVTAYNLERYLPDTLDSVLAQDMDDWECIVVDDASPDACGEIAEAYAARDPRFVVVHNETNLYLAGARNAGIARSRGKYILPLDADDMLTTNTLSTLADALDRYRGLHIVYGNVLFVDEDGHTPTHYANDLAPGHSGWPVDFRLDWMLLRPGQPMPYCSMFRREMWSLLGGYRARARSSEDCDLWIRSTSYGFVAQMVTRADTLVYRNREGSMSREQGWEEHRGWYPWVRDPATIPAAAYRGTGIKGDQVNFPALDPVISVVIPVGPGHARWMFDAIDSVDAQTFRLWECIVVNDTGEPLPPLPTWVLVVERPCPECDGDPARIVGSDRASLTVSICETCRATGLGRFGGAAAARNAGIRVSRGPLYLPLDADDFLQPIALDLMFRAHLDSGEHRAVVYSDFWDEKAPGQGQVYQCPDYDPRALTRRGLGRAVTALTPKRYWEDVGGYDEHVAWEDWAFAISLAARGYCERRVSAPLFTYRKWTGLRREQNLADFEASRASIMAKDFGTQGGELMACGSCPGGRSSTYGALGIPQPSALQMSGARPTEDGMVLVEYNGGRSGDVEFRSNVKGQAPYRFSLQNRQKWVRKEDAEYFARNPDFRLPRPEEIEARAVPAAAVHAPVLVASGAPRGGTAVAEAGEPSAGLPMWREVKPEPPMVAGFDAGVMTPSSVVVSPPAPSAPREGTVATVGNIDLSEARQDARAAEGQRAQGDGDDDPDVLVLKAEHTRTSLNALAIEEGIAGAASLGNMTLVARAIMAVRRAKAQQP